MAIQVISEQTRLLWPYRLYQNRDKALMAIRVISEQTGALKVITGKRADKKNLSCHLHTKEV